MAPRPIAFRSLLATLALALPAATAPLPADVFSTGDVELLAFGDLAANDASPIRVVTATPPLDFKNTIALDLVHREVFIGRSGEITVVSSNAAGSTTILRTLSGALTGLGTVTGIAVDLEHDLLYVACYDTDEVSVFHRTDQGNVPPLRVLAGAATTLDFPEGLLVDLVHGELVVAISTPGSGAIATFALAAFQGSGTFNIAPVRRIAGPTTTLDQPRGVALDLETDRLLVADRGAAAVDHFARLANGNAAPVQRIVGVNTGLGAVGEIQLLAGGDLLVGNDGSDQPALVFHHQSDSGNATAFRQIVGPSTQLQFATSVASSRARDCAWAKSVDGCLFRDNFEGADPCDWSAAAAGPICP